MFNRMKPAKTALLTVLFTAFLVSGCGSSGKSQGDTEMETTWKPDGTIEIVAPAGPGGGWDLLARTMEKTLRGDKLVEKPIVITNKPGGGGATGWTYLNTHKGNGNYLTVNSSLVLLNQILGSSQLSYQDFTPLAMLQAEWEIVAVKKDSPYKTGKEFFEALKADPSKISVAVGPSLGNDDHIQFLMLAKAYGIQDLTKIKFIVYPGAGGEEIPALLGGHVQAMSISLGEALEQYKAGNIRILGISSEKRLTGADVKDIPTWKEQGVDMTFAHWRGVMGPGGMTPEQIAYWEDAIEKMVQQPSWKDAMKKMNMDEFYMPPEEYQAYLDQQYEEMTQLLKTIGMVK